MISNPFRIGFAVYEVGLEWSMNFSIRFIPK